MVTNTNTKSPPTPDNITAAEFKALLDQYPSLIESIPKAKGANPGQQKKTLAELDRFRYEEALELFGPGGKGGPRRAMTLDDVKTLVEWKLRHGKFRPTLMGLVSSNDPQTAQDTIQEAIRAFSGTSDSSNAATAAALAVLTRLRGIGPATASLLLAVHFPAEVPFFADEAFLWLCSGGGAGGIKYNTKEYRLLCERTAALIRRLGSSSSSSSSSSGAFRAVDVERAAFVAVRLQQQQQQQQENGEKEADGGRRKGAKAVNAAAAAGQQRATKPPPPIPTPKARSESAKRKQSVVCTDNDRDPAVAAVAAAVSPPLRRSKRGKPA